MEMKGIYYSIEIILSILFLTSIFFIIYSYFESLPKSEVLPFSKNSSQAILNDIYTILVSNKAKNYIQDLNLTDESVLEAHVSYFVSGNYEKSKEIIEKALGNLINSTCFQIWIENNVSYSNCNITNAENVRVIEYFVSGFEFGKQPKGYVARAWLTQYKKTITEVFDFFVSGSGWKVVAGNGGNFEYYKIFEIPESAIIHNAKIYVSMHVGNAKTPVPLFNKFEINGYDISNSVRNNVVYLDCIGSLSETNCAIYSIVDISNLILPGKNYVYISVGAPSSYHAHFHPGFKLSVNYSINESLKVKGNVVLKRIYFDKIIGRTGAWIMIPFEIPLNAIFYNASLFLSVKNLEDTYIRNFNTSDILIFLNSEKPIFKDGNDYFGIYYPYWPRYCNYIDFRNYYCNRYVASTKNLNISLNLTQYLIKGTNTLMIYLNSFEDYHWGKDYAEISNNSYIDIYYVLNSSLLEYGEIEIKKELETGSLGLIHSNPYVFNFSVKKDVNSAIIHLAQGFSSMINASINNIAFYTSPTIRAVPSHFFLNPSLIVKDFNNIIKLTDFQPSGGISPQNLILNYTSLEYSFKVKGIVGYGNVFETQEEAIEDAINRLKNQVGDEVEISNVNIDTKSVFGLRWTYGPLRVLIIMA